MESNYYTVIAIDKDWSGGFQSPTTNGEGDTRYGGTGAVWDRCNIEIQRIDDELRERMEASKQEKIKRVTEIFHKISCDRDAIELNTMEMEHIIGFYDRYTVLATTNNYRPNAGFVLDSLKSFEVISKLGIKNAQTDDIMDTYRKRRITGNL